MRKVLIWNIYIIGSAITIHYFTKLNIQRRYDFQQCDTELLIDHLNVLVTKGDSDVTNLI